MAIDIKVTGGVNFNAWLADFVGFNEIGNRGAFSNGFSGDEYALWEDADQTIPVADGRAFVADSGSEGDLSYDFATNTVNGTLDSLEFGEGVTDKGGGDFDTAGAVLLSKLGLEGQGAGNEVTTLLGDLMRGGTDALKALLAGEDLNFKGSAGDDAFKGFGDGDDTISGGKGNDVLNGKAGEDVINGGAGDDKLTGGADDDLFIFAGKNFGADKISGFEGGKGRGDQIQFSENVFDSFADVLDAARETRGGVVITIDDDSSVTLKGAELADLHSSDFLFV